ncbi:MAG: hypothetical protein AB1938_26660 [Myxococcota bacterium]
MRSVFPVVLALLTSGGVWAQSSDTPAPPEPSSPPLTEPPPSIPPAFFRLMLTVDEKGQVYEGRQRTPLTPREVFQKADRMDLIERSDTLARRRLGLAIGAGAVAAVGSAVGIALIALAPSAATPECEADVKFFNEVCVPRHMAYETAGSAVLVSSLVVGSLLATLAWWSNPTVLSRDEMTALVSGYNARLKRQLTEGGPSSLRLSPYIGPGQAGLVGTMRW